MRRDMALLEDLMATCNDLLEMTAGKMLTDVAGDKQPQYAVLHSFTIIGEASSRLSAEIRTRYPQVQWSHVRGFRNRIVHEYFGLDWSLLWKTASADIPVFRRQIGEIIQAEDSPADATRE